MIEPTPSSQRANAVEAAVAPPPSTVAVTNGPGLRSRTAATAPGTSVLSADQVPPSRTSVLTAPARRAHGPTSTMPGSESASRLSGIVSDSPRQSSSRPATKAASPPAGTRRAS